MFIAWANNDTGHWNVFVAKSTEAGKTLKIMMISAPNNGSNQLNLNLFGGLVTGGILAVAGIIALIVGPVVLIVDRRRITRNKRTGT